MRKDFYLFRRNRIWYAQYRDPVTGELGTPKSTHQSNKVAADKYADREVKRTSELSEFPPMSLGQWGEKFFVDKCPHKSRLAIDKKRIGEKYIARNRAIWMDIISKDPICGLQVYDIRKKHCLMFRKNIVDTFGLRRKTQTIWSCFRLIISDAFYYGLTDHDPCQGVSQVKYDKKIRVCMTRDQVKAILDPDKWNGSPYYEPTFAAGVTGMRRGEVRGLKWGGLDKGLNSIFVENNLPGEVGKGKDTDPKWGKKRVSPYPEVLQKMLEPRRGKDDEYVFHIGSHPIGAKRWLDAFKKVAKEVGAEGATIHSLRHSLHNILLEDGVSDALLRATFGWSSEKTEEIYTHRELFDKKAQFDAIENFFTKKGGANGSV